MGRCEDKRISYGCCVIRRRCICWCEPIRIRPRRRCCNTNFQGLNLQLTTTSNLEISACCPVIFDEILTDDSWVIDYDENDGVIELRRQGLYAIDWSIVCDSNTPNTCIRFGVEVDGKLQSTVAMPAGHPQQLIGNTIVKTGRNPVKIRLVNTGSSVTLPSVEPVANLRILAID